MYFDCYSLGFPGKDCRERKRCGKHGPGCVDDSNCPEPHCKEKDPCRRRHHSHHDPCRRRHHPHHPCDSAFMDKEAAEDMVEEDEDER